MEGKNKNLIIKYKSIINYDLLTIYVINQLIN